MVIHGNGNTTSHYKDGHLPTHAMGGCPPSQRWSPTFPWMTTHHQKTQRSNLTQGSATQQKSWSKMQKVNLYPGIMNPDTPAQITIISLTACSSPPKEPH